MKVALSSTGKNLNSNLSEVFARCPFFIIAEIEEGKIKKFEVIENEFANQMGGAGISVSQFLAEKGVEVVICKNIGPRAFEVLTQFGIKIFQGKGTAKKVLEKFIEQKLEEFEK
jgi:predicted Fe-Mo cluster-binding NifX family protein